jgi:transcriptional regulator GlxA family with amidase domain
MQRLEPAVAHSEVTPSVADSLANPSAYIPATRPAVPVVAPGGKAGGGLAPHRLQRVLACIETRLAERIQVRELADEIHMSPFHFARMFKLATGHAPHAYITRQRMDRAKDLLAQTQLPLLEVAARVGYQTQAHFTGVFHRYVGTTPRVYRLQQRGGMVPAAQA